MNNACLAHCNFDMYIANETCDTLTVAHEQMQVRNHLKQHLLSRIIISKGLLIGFKIPNKLDLI